MKAIDYRMPRDVTSDYDDVNDYDRLYRTEHGYLAKVRVEDRTAHASVLTFLVTGSWADDETGKARVWLDAPFIVEPHEASIRPDSPTDLAEELESARILMARRVDLAASNHAARSALTGVKRG